MIPIRVKSDDVDIANLAPAMYHVLLVAATRFEHYGASEVVITSGCERDGKHSVGSRHWSGDAVDLRTDPNDHWGIWVDDEVGGYDANHVRDLALTISRDLGGDFDVVLEDDHLHIERHPKQ